MSQYLIFEGKNLDLALEAAAKKLAQDAAGLRYEVVSYGSSGIFGLVGAKKARIRVRVDADGRHPTFQSEAKREARDLVKDAFNLKDKTQSKPKKETPQPSSETLTEAIDIGTEALDKIVREITEDTRITVESRSDRLLFKVDGGNSAVLIGKRGQTLEAIQYLVEKIVNKQANTRIRVLVDVKGYLGTRKASLKKLALRLAEKARKHNKPVTVGQMNAYERRIVHMTLKDVAEVRTQSMGEGYYRKLMIFPKRRKGRKNRGSAEP